MHSVHPQRHSIIISQVPRLSTSTSLCLDRGQDHVHHCVGMPSPTSKLIHNTNLFYDCVYSKVYSHTTL